MTPPTLFPIYENVKIIVRKLKNPHLPVHPLEEPVRCRDALLVHAGAPVSVGGSPLAAGGRGEGADAVHAVVNAFGGPAILIV